MDAAGRVVNMLGFGPRLFSAVHRPEGVNFAYCFAFGVISKTGADIGKFAAFAAAQTFAFAGF